MNPSVKFFLVLFMSLELSLNRSIYANFYVLSISVLLLLLARSSFKKILWLLLMPLIPAFGTGLSFYMHGSGDYLYNTWLYSSRIYALVWLGAYLTFTIDTSELLDSLYQNCHLPAKFTYGFMGAFNFIPQVFQTVKKIKSAAMMRGMILHFWSPQLFFKAILTSLRWSESLAKGMESHAFSEQAERSHFKSYSIPLWNWIAVFLWLAGLQFFIFWSKNI